MRRKLIALAFCVLLIFIGCYVWDSHFRQYGSDEFDEAFLLEFDAVRIVDNIDKLVNTGLFSFEHNDAMEFPQIVVRWPIESDFIGSPVCILIEQNAPSYYRETMGYRIDWETPESFSEFSTLPEELSEYKYIYTFYFWVPKGQIRYIQAGNSRLECMEAGRKNLLWLMSLT